jgi:membrane protease YdiL (CAAX protease family)
MTVPSPQPVRGGGTPGFWLALVAFVVVWSVRATAAYRVDQSLEPDARAIYSMVVKLALWAAPAVAFVLWVRRDSMRGGLRLGAPAWRSLPVFGAVIAAYLAGVALDVARKRGIGLGDLGQALAERGATTFASAMPSALAEEVLFRGLVLTELTERFGFWRGNVLSSAIFVAMHWPHRLWRDGLALGVVADAPALLLLSLALGVVAWRTGSIWPAVLFHTANNTLSGVF